MLNDAFFVALGFFLFVALLGYLGVHKTIGKSLDDRGQKIQAELDEAKRLREEAAAVLASFEKKRAEAEAEAQAIVDFEARIEMLVNANTTREQVIAWMMDAESANGDYEYFCFCVGLPYGYFRKVA